MNKKNQNLHSS